MLGAIERGMGRGQMRRTTRSALAIYPVALFLFLAWTAVLQADIAPDQVLVVYNSASAEAVTLKDAYLAAHPGIPAANVLDLNNAALLTADLSYAQFTADVRDPIRGFLSLPAAPAPEDIIAIALIRPFPHRILDTDVPLAGDAGASASTELSAGDATFASVDSELVLLWQNLDTGEAGGTMDSKSDNLIDNPYHMSAAQIDTFTRVNIQTAKAFLNASNFAWRLGGAGATRLTAGDMYLVCRIDGTTLADAEAVIDRARGLHINKALVRIILDEFDVSTDQDLDDDQVFSFNDPFNAGDDYEKTRDALLLGGWDVRYDGTFDFIEGTEETTPLTAYASYGENHSRNGLGENPLGNGTYIEGFLFPPGAVFNTIESFNGRALNGLGTQANHEQIADFITAGGTFAIGNVFEPFTFPIADNEFLFINLLSGQLTWAEVAYTALPALSWQQVVLGDPLAKPVILDDPGLPIGDLDGDGLVNANDIQPFLLAMIDGFDAYHAAFPALDPTARGDFTGDFRLAADDVPGFLAELLAP